MKKEGRQTERRRGARRRLLTENEFRRLIETGKVSRSDRRAWTERRKKKKVRSKKDS